MALTAINAPAQCNSVRDLPDSTQKKILAKFLEGRHCDTLRMVDSVYISELKMNKIQLQKDLTVAAEEITILQKEVIRRKKRPWITGAIGFLVGVYSGTRLVR